MPQESLKVACNACQVGLEGPAEPGPHDMFVCPSCGLSAPFQTIQREIGEWVAEGMAQPIQDGIARGVGRGGPIKFVPKKLPKKVHRFGLIQD
jgi:hypothetical protein